MCWDNDIDLDELLGEYTDHEEKSSDQLPKEEHTYQCPDCQKILKSISGFRGHMTRQHKKSKTKASDHRVTATSCATAENNDSPPPSCSVDIENVLHEASLRTLTRLEDGPMHNLFGESVIVRLARFCRKVQFLEQPLVGHLKDIFSCNLCDTHARELFFTKFHSLRLSKCVQMECVSLFILNGCEEKREDIIHFLQEYLLELPTEILGRLLQENRTTSNTHADQISNMDQQILYYISGFIVANLKKKCMRMTPVYREERLQLLEKLFCKTGNSSFVAKFDAWLKKNSRGGLLRPTDNFYLLVRELEIIIRRIPNHSHMQSLYSCQVKESMMESFMVNHYVKELFGEYSEGDLSPLLEDIIGVFLTVRGFATARVLRNKLGGRTSKQSDSLRQALKSKNNN